MTVPLTLPERPTPEQTPAPGGSQRATPLGELAPRIPPAPVVEPFQPPPPPIALVRGGQYPDMDAPEGAKVEYLKRCIARTDSESLARIRTMTYHLLMANGKQHIGWSDRTRTYSELPLEPNEQRVTFNYIRPILRARTQRLLPDRLDWTVIPDSNDYDARDSALVAERFLDAITRQSALTQKIDTALELAYCGGVAFLKAFWNPTIGPAKAATASVTEQTMGPLLDPVTQQPILDPETGEPVQVPQVTVRDVYVNELGEPVDTAAEAYRFRPGDVDTAVRSLFNVRWNPDATGFTPGEGLRWVLDRDAIPLDAARERWPEYATKIKATGDASSILTYERMAQMATLKQPGHGQSSGGASGRRSGAGGSQEWTTVIEYWEMPSRYFPEGRLLVSVGDCIVDDGPWPDGVFPYIPIYDEPVPLSPGGRGVVQDLVGLQATLNELMAGMVMAWRFRGLGQWITLNAPGVPEQVTAQHGAIIRLPPHILRGRSLRDMMVPLEHPTLPADLGVLITQVQNAMYAIGAYHEVTRGQTPPGVTSGVAVRALSEREDGQLKRAQKALRESMIRWGRTVLQIAVANYAPGDERWVPVDRPDLGYQVESVSGEKLPDPERVLIELTGFKPRSEEELRAEVKEAMQLGWMTPAQGLKALDFGRGISTAFESEQRHMAKARRENLGIENGEVVAEPILGPDGQPLVDVTTGEPVPPVVLWAGNREPLLLDDVDDHVTHMSVLEEIILDRTKQDTVRRLAYAHWQEHQRAMMAMVPLPVQPESDNSAPPQPPQPPQ
jgi:hypothetical protein